MHQHIITLVSGASLSAYMDGQKLYIQSISPSQALQVELDTVIDERTEQRLHMLSSSASVLGGLNVHLHPVVQNDVRNDMTKLVMQGLWLKRFDGTNQPIGCGDKVIIEFRDARGNRTLANDTIQDFV
jgi:hypothetical protein